MRLAGALALAVLVVTTSAEATTIARVTLPQMERSSTVVFVGEFVTGTRAPLGGFPGRRYHFRVQRLLHGGPSEHVHLFVPDFAGLSLGVRPGANHLVFAERRRFGRGKEERLTATGYYRVFARSPRRAAPTALERPRAPSGARDRPSVEVRHSPCAATLRGLCAVGARSVYRTARYLSSSHWVSWIR